MLTLNCCNYLYKGFKFGPRCFLWKLRLAISFPIISSTHATVRWSSEKRWNMYASFSKSYKCRPHPKKDRDKDSCLHAECHSISILSASTIFPPNVHLGLSHSFCHVCITFHWVIFLKEISGFSVFVVRNSGILLVCPIFSVLSIPWGYSGII